MKKFNRFESQAGEEVTFTIEEPISALMFADVSEELEPLNVDVLGQAGKLKVTVKLILPNSDPIVMIDKMTLLQLSLANLPFNNPVVSTQTTTGDTLGLSIVKLTDLGSLILGDKGAKKMAYLEVTLSSTLNDLGIETYGLYSPKGSKQYLSYNLESIDADNDIKLDVRYNSHVVIPTKEVKKVTRNYGNGNSDTVNLEYLNFYQAGQGLHHFVSSSGDVIDPELGQTNTVLPLVSDGINVKSIVFDASSDTEFVFVKPNQYLR